MSDELSSKIKKASKWSAITEILSKLVSPLSTIVLARLLTPDSFGILVTAIMVISFAEIFTDAGFQKYLIQHSFKNNQEKNESITVAFWSNLFLSTIIFFIICLFSTQISNIVGCPGYERVIIISSFCIPIEAFSSIQMAVFKRDFDFKTLFLVRIVGVFIPILFTIPIAYLTHSFWSLIIGLILSNASNAIILTIKSPWKPNFFFSFLRLKAMLSFSIWTVIEAISIWLTTYLDVFVVGTILSQHFLGIYKTSMNLVAQMTNIFVAMTVPVLFSALSRLQDQPKEFQNCLFKFQKYVGILLIPTSAGIYLFRDAAVNILLGQQWHEAAFFVGIWGLTTGVTIIFSHYGSEVYRALGKPKISFLSQTLHLVVMIPVVFYFSQFSFDILCTARVFVRLEGVLVNILLMWIFVRLSPLKMFSNIFPSIIASVVMFVITNKLLVISDYAVYTQCILFFTAILIYFSILLLFKNERKLIYDIVKRKLHK